ncbi:MAG: hypothetical protein JSS21_02865 [Proteobacteria bacterium]|nr:hypothetical protein [Pseudomonadota bacterium]
MSPEIVTAIIAGAVGLITGALGSLVAPWVNWGVEKLRKKRESRASLISTWHAVIADPNFDRGLMLEHPTYGTLKPLLSERAIKQLHRPQNNIIITQGMDNISYADLSLLQGEIARVEREWGLV